MVGALGLLKCFERGGVLALPVEPSLEPGGRLFLRRAGALDAEGITRLDDDGARHPLAVTGIADDADAHNAPKRRGASGASNGSIRFSSIASATSRAVSGASSIPLRKCPEAYIRLGSTHEAPMIGSASGVAGRSPTRAPLKPALHACGVTSQAA